MLVSSLRSRPYLIRTFRKNSNTPYNLPVRVGLRTNSKELPQSNLRTCLLPPSQGLALVLDAEPCLLSSDADARCCYLIGRMRALDAAASITTRAPLSNSSPCC